MKRRGNPDNPAFRAQMGKGRPKGCKNKFTDVKTAFLKAFGALGHEDYVKEFAGDRKNAEAFLKIIARMLPQDVKVEPKGEIIVEVVDKYGEPEVK
jgi:hypothetical protein